MTEYFITSTKFYNELRNGPLFNLNPTEFTNSISGCVGELVQVVSEFEIRTEILAEDFGTIHFEQSGSEGIFTFNGSWFDEGLSIGSTIDISWAEGVNIATETVTSLNGTLGNILVTTLSVDLQKLPDGDRPDLVFRVSSVPDRLSYKYALNELSATRNNYKSPFDSNEQAYFEVIGGSLTELSPIGNFGSWNLGTVEARTVATVDTYTHQYELVHTFRIPYYLADQAGNITNDPPLPPTRLIGTGSLKYGFGIFLAETNNDFNKIFEEPGQAGTVKYFDESVGRLPVDFTVQDVAYSNAEGTNTLEVTETTTVTCQVKKGKGNFSAGQRILLNHSKLATESDYQNKKESFDEIWLRESLIQSEGAVAVSNTIITNYTITLNADPSLLDVSFDIAYSSDQQKLLSKDTNYLLSFIMADETKGVYDTDKANMLLPVEPYSQNGDVVGLVQNNDMRFFDSGGEIHAPAGQQTDFKGWDGDFVGVSFAFETKAELGALVQEATFRLIADNGTDSFVLNQIPISIGKVVVTDEAITTYRYQLTNVDHQNSYNITPNESFNRIVLDSVEPAPATSFQSWSGALAFKVTWRDWIKNTAVPQLFYDATKPQDNRNIKTSNYSEQSSYEIFGVLDLRISSDVGDDTIYRLKSGKSIILDFDDNDGSSFVGTTSYFDINGDPVGELYTNANQEVTIQIEFDHTDGILTDPYGEIVIEPNNTVQEEWRLSTEKDWSNASNPLSPSDTLVTGNTQFVEMINVFNKVTLICKTNISNLTQGTNYRVYGILGEK